MDAVIGAILGVAVGVVIGSVVQASSWAAKAKNETVMQHAGERYCVLLESEFLALRRAKRDFEASRRRYR